MGPSPSWTPLSNLRLMVAYPSPCTGNPHIQTSICSGTVTITSQPSLVSSILSLIGPKQCAASLELFQQEKDHLRKALTKCKYPKWALDKVEKILKSTNEVFDGVNNQGTTDAQAVTSKVQTKGHIVIPYTQDLCESIKKICGRYGIQTHFKGGSTIKNLLVSPKNKDHMVNQSAAIYWYQCGDLGCDDEYIGGTSRTFGEKIQRAPEGPLTHSSPQQPNRPAC